MTFGPVWDVGMLLGGIGGSGVTTWFVVSYKLGKRDGANAVTIESLSADVKELKEANEKSGNRQANQFLRIFQAIEQLRRLHKTGNGGVNWTDLTGGD